jgi:hypothetical protein
MELSIEAGSLDTGNRKRDEPTGQAAYRRPDDTAVIPAALLGL